MRATGDNKTNGPPGDPRRYQIFCLSLVMVYGLYFLDFGRHLDHFAISLSGALFVQLLCLLALRRLRPDRNIPFDFKSALITGLSLCLLLRTDSLWVAAPGVVIAIAGKFLIRWNDKHVFNPSLLGIVALLLLFDGAWVSPGQWGRGGLLLFGVALAGGLTLYRSLRVDITFAFLGTYVALVVGRALYLGDPAPVALHQLSSGALLIFACFMISDPRSTPDRRGARMLFAAGVASTAVYIQFVLYNTNALLWSLAIWSFATPLLDRLLPGRRFVWRSMNHSNNKKIAPAAPAIPDASGPLTPTTTYLEQNHAT